MTDMASPQRLDEYIRHGSRKIKGWLTFADAELIRTVGLAQRDFGISGAVGEIGVHHGKLFILLYLMRTKQEKAFAVDVFDMQSLNIDNSGHGNQVKFLRNVQNVAGNTCGIDIFHASSTEITWSDIYKKINQNVRLFSIDGGHTASITYNDLGIAKQSLSKGGVIIIDDYFNLEWPGVSEGVIKFFCKNASLVPFAIGENKVLICHPKYSLKYRSYLLERIDNTWHRKDSMFLDNEVSIFIKPQTIYDRIKQSDFARKYKDHPVVKPIKPIINRIFQ